MDSKLGRNSASSRTLFRIAGEIGGNRGKGGREGALNGTRTPVSNRDNERPFAGGPFCICAIGIHLALAHAYVRNPTSCLGSTRVPPRKTSHAINFVFRGRKLSIRLFYVFSFFLSLLLSFPRINSFDSDEKDG